MKVIYSDKHALHDPEKFMVGGFMVDHPEKPKRAEILLNASREFGLELTEPESYGPNYLYPMVKKIEHLDGGNSWYTPRS